MDPATGQLLVRATGTSHPASSPSAGRRRLLQTGSGTNATVLQVRVSPPPGCLCCRMLTFFSVLDRVTHNLFPVANPGLSVGVEFHNRVVRLLPLVVRLLPLCDGFHICPASLLIDLGVQSWNKTTAESRLLARLQLSLTLLALLVLRLHLLQLLLLSNTSFL